jgi:hypothetical protein
MRRPIARPWLTAAGALAAVGFIVKGIQELETGAGWAMLVIAAALILALVLRQTRLGG